MPLNWTASSATAHSAFGQIVDAPMPGRLEELGSVLDSAKIAVIYGYRDFIAMSQCIRDIENIVHAPPRRPGSAAKQSHSP